MRFCSFTENKMSKDKIHVSLDVIGHVEDNMIEGSTNMIEGPTLLETLDLVNPSNRPTDLPMRDVCKMDGVESVESIDMHHQALSDRNVLLHRNIPEYVQSKDEGSAFVDDLTDQERFSELSVFDIPLSRASEWDPDLTLKFSPNLSQDHLLWFLQYCRDAGTCRQPRVLAHNHIMVHFSSRPEAIAVVTAMNHANSGKLRECRLALWICEIRDPRNEEYPSQCSIPFRLGEWIPQAYQQQH